jgi:hypothetical protein
MHKKVISCLEQIDSHIKQNNQLLWEKYIRLGSKTVRLLCYSQDFIPLIKKQLSYALKDSSANFDATIVLWNEKEVEKFLQKFIDSHAQSRIRLNQLVFKKKKSDFEITDNTDPAHKLLTRINCGAGIANSLELLDEAYSKHNPLVRINAEIGIINAYSPDNNIYYYGVRDLSPEEFIKHGHIFVQIFNKIIKTPNSHLVHGAVVGLNNQGILFCAKGQKGKSTLACMALMQDFDYVSDDYLVLEKEGNELYSYPIYSIITLSPRMYNELYDDLRGKFVSNNARKDKYVIDVQAYHNKFRSKYPIKICMFPQITADKNPSIVPCKKGSAIVQLIYSTINQMEDKHDIKTIQKLISFIKDFDFYQINLSPNIKANVECLREFLGSIK